VPVKNIVRKPLLGSLTVIALAVGLLVGVPATDQASATLSCPPPLAPSAPATDDGVAGSAGNPFLIASVGNMQHLLQNLSDTTGKFYKLTADINYEVTNDGQTRSCDLARNVEQGTFMGNLDGDGHSISNFQAYAVGAAGLFPQTDEATITNLVIDGAAVLSDGSFAGGLAGDIRNTTLTNITVKNSFVRSAGAGGRVGGIAGEAGNDQSAATLSKLRVINSYIIADRYFGGLFGQVLNYPTITEVAVLGTMVSTTGVHQPNDAAEAVGGLIGRATADLTLSKASFQGAIVLQQSVLNSAGLLVGDANGRNLIITDSSVRGVMTTFSGVTAGGVHPAGLVGKGAGSTTVIRAIVQVKFERTRSSDVQVRADQFLPGETGEWSSVLYDREVHTNWPAIYPEVARSSAELANPATYEAVAGWSVTTDVARVEAGAASETWLMSSAPGNVVENGFPVHTWLYEGVTGNEIDPCMIGFFRPASLGLSLGCLPSEPGTFVAVPGATEATACAAGRYQDSYASMYCLDAAPGSFVSASGQIRAELCPAGSFQDDAAALGCKPAPAGTAIASLGATAPTDCEPGTFQDELGEQACKQAPPGKFVAIPAATEAVPCQLGRYQPDFGQVSCLLSPPGSYVPFTGLSAPLLCPAGFTSDAGADSCFRIVDGGGGGGGGGFVPPGAPIIDVPEQTLSEPKPRAWTRFIGNNQLKMYARDIVGAGKVQFFLNGREIAWVRATDGSDPKLNVRSAAGEPGDGMVRTVTAAAGRNVLEIYVGDERVARRVFTR
jgi:hypothetical protein